MKEQRKQKKGNKSSMKEKENSKRCGSVSSKTRESVLSVANTNDEYVFQPKGEISDTYYDEEDNVYVLVPKRDLYICGNCLYELVEEFCLIPGNPERKYDCSDLTQKYYGLKKCTAKEWKKIEERLNRGETVKVGDIE
jgi:hypothetical protein